MHTHTHICDKCAHAHPCAHTHTHLCVCVSDGAYLSKLTKPDKYLLNCMKGVGMIAFVAHLCVYVCLLLTFVTTFFHSVKLGHGCTCAHTHTHMHTHMLVPCILNLTVNSKLKGTTAPIKLTNL